MIKALNELRHWLHKTLPVPASELDGIEISITFKSAANAAMAKAQALHELNAPYLSIEKATLRILGFRIRFCYDEIVPEHHTTGEV